MHNFSVGISPKQDCSSPVTARHLANPLHPFNPLQPQNHPPPYKKMTSPKQHCSLQPDGSPKAPPYRLRLINALIADCRRLERAGDALADKAQAAGFPVSLQSPVKIRLRAERERRTIWARIAAAAGPTEVAEVSP